VALTDEVNSKRKRKRKREEKTGEVQLLTVGLGSVRTRVCVIGQPQIEVVLEADILDDDHEFTPNQVEYAYDVFNQLVRRTYDSDGPAGPAAATDTFFSHHAGQINLQFDGPAASNLSHRYFWNPVAVDQLLADEKVTSLSSAGDVLWPLADHLGTIRDIATHDSQTHETTIANHRVYESFGQLVSETNTAVDEIFGFTGRLFDEATYLQNNLNRWYDASTGRWISEDPIGFAGGDPNLSRYVGNNPLNYTDPSGLARIPKLDLPAPQKSPHDMTWTEWFYWLLANQAPIGPTPLCMAGGFGSAGGALGNVGGTLGKVPIRGPILGPLGGGMGNIGSQVPRPASEILSGAIKWLGPGYKEIGPGVFRSCDGLRQFRWTSAGKSAPYFNFEALDTTGKVIENLHVPIIP
jgi:RHS repeat-associated protein